MKINLLFYFSFLPLLFLAEKIAAQIGINAIGTPPATNAMLDISSTTKGLLIPRMTTTQRNALTASDGLTVYDTDTKGYWFYNGTSWQNLSTVAGNTPWLTAGNNIYNANTGNVGIGTNSPEYKFDVLHNGNSGLRVKSSFSYSVIDIDAASGEAAMKFSKNGAQRWTIRNEGLTDNLDFFQNGSRMTLQNNTGNLGINDVAPLARLSIGGNIKIADGTQAAGKVLTSIDGSGTANWQSLPVQNNYWTANGQNIYNNNATNVGIGTSTPGFPLNFANALGDKISLWGNAGNHYGFGIQSGLLQIHSDAVAADVAFGYGRSGAFTETMRIKGDGQLLLNSTSQESLWINGPTGNYITLAENTITRGYLGSYSGADQDIELGTHTQNPTGSVHLSTGNVPRLTVRPDGNVGIGNTNPAKPLSFPSALGEKILLYPGGVGEVGIGVYGNELRLHADNPGAKVSFGTQDNAGVFTENAKAERNGAYAFSIFGSLWVNGTTYASDQRFKKNIKPMGNSLSKLILLQGVNYDMNTDEFKKNNFKSTKDIGLIAQEVLKIFPEVVAEKDGYLGIDYGKLVPVLIESIKEQQKQIEELLALVKGMNK